jgi:predicted NUDIX family NTP pyrophosphohydrolase
VPALSAGVVLYRRADRGLEVLLVHPGGPFWARKDLGAWSFPKGEYAPEERPLDAALREFREELGSEPPPGRAPIPLGEVRQSGGKVVTAFAIEGDLDADAIVSGSFEMEWPPRSGRRAEFPEVDRAAWFTLEEARPKLVSAQAAFLDRLDAALAER